MRHTMTHVIDFNARILLSPFVVIWKRTFAYIYMRILMFLTETPGKMFVSWHLLSFFLSFFLPVNDSLLLFPNYFYREYKISVSLLMWNQSIFSSDVLTLKVCNFPKSCPYWMFVARVTHYLDTVFYNLNTVALYDWKVPSVGGCARV